MSARVVFCLTVLAIASLVTAQPMALTNGQKSASATQSELSKGAQPTTLIKVMPARYIYLRSAWRGFERTHSFLAMDDPAMKLGDDVGIYILVPAVALLFSTSLVHAIDITLLGLVGAGFLSCVAALFRLIRSYPQRLLAALWVTYTFLITLYSGDVYIVSAAVVAGTVPWLLVLEQHDFGGTVTPWMFVVLGFLLACAHTIRAHSGTAVALFAMILLWSSRRATLMRKAILSAALLIATTPPLLLVGSIVEHRNELLQISGTSRAELPAHPFWHTAYIGFGFLSNPDIPAYADETAIAKVQSIDPSVPFVSRHYEQILRKETLRFVRTHITFVGYTVAAKTAVILLLLCICGTPFAFAGRFHWRKRTAIHIAFWTAIAFNCLPGLIAVPNPKYLLGAITFSVMYGIWRWNIQNEFDPVSKPTIPRQAKALSVARL